MAPGSGAPRVAASVDILASIGSSGIVQPVCAMELIAVLFAIAVLLAFGMGITCGIAIGCCLAGPRLAAPGVQPHAGRETQSWTYGPTSCSRKPSVAGLVGFTGLNSEVYHTTECKGVRSARRTIWAHQCLDCEKVLVKSR